MREMEDLMSGHSLYLHKRDSGRGKRLFSRTGPLNLISRIAVFVIIGGFSVPQDRAFCESQKTVQGDGVLQFLRQDGSTVASITIEIADTPEARIKGLMERWSLPEHHGMLFVFDSQEIQRFWMHRTPLSLDMIFADEKGRILNIAESTTPMSKQTYSSKGPAKYVVEVRAGFSKQHGIEEGMKIQFQVRPTTRN